MSALNLPNYFLADLPPEATLSAPMITEACQTLKRNRDQYLARRTTDSIIRATNGWQAAKGLGLDPGQFAPH